MPLRVLPALLVSFLFMGCIRNRPVGFMGGLSGPSSELAMMGRDGARLFFEEQGARMLICDTRGEPSGASRCVKELVDSGVVVILGPMTSRTVDSALAAATRHGAVLVSPTVSSHLVTGHDDALLRVIGSNLDQADTLASLLRSRNVRRPLVMWEMKNAAYTKILAHRILERMGMADSIATRSVGYTTSTDISFDSLVASHSDADAFVIAASAMDAAVLCHAIRNSGSSAPIFGPQFAMGGDLIRIGGSHADGFVVAAAAGFSDSSSERKEFHRRFVERYRREPSFGAGFGWEAASISHPGWNAPDAMTAKRRILEAPIQSPLGEPLPFDSFGDVKRRVVAHVVRNGRFEVLE
jgi:branched-chain amino acid transport system substrate-binding protein